MAAQCMVELCEKPARTRGWCTKHYQRWRKHGDPEAVRLILGDDVARFWAKVDKTDDCWLWTGQASRGYGQMRQGDRRVYVHRFAYELLVGPIPQGLELDHLCRVRRCVNPAHLEPVTSRENTLRSDNPAAQNARKTHCPLGHPYDFVSSGKRRCRTCSNDQRRLRVVQRRAMPARGRQLSGQGFT